MVDDQIPPPVDIGEALEQAAEDEAGCFGMVPSIMGRLEKNTDGTLLKDVAKPGDIYVQTLSLIHI